MRRGSSLFLVLFLFPLTACDESSWNDWTFNPSGVYTRIEEKCGGRACSEVPNFPINAYLPENISIDRVGLYFDNYPIFVLITDIQIYENSPRKLILKLFEEKLLSHREQVRTIPSPPFDVIGPDGVPPCFSADPIFSVEVIARSFFESAGSIARPLGTTEIPGFEVIARYDQHWVGRYCPKDLEGTRYFYRAVYIRTEGPIAPLERYESPRVTPEKPYPDYQNAHPIPTDWIGVRGFIRRYFNLRTDLL